MEKHEVVERGTRQPTTEDIRELVAFLPRLYEKGLNPSLAIMEVFITRMGSTVLPQPMYHELMNEFVDVIHKQDCWNDYKFQLKGMKDYCNLS